MFPAPGLVRGSSDKQTDSRQQAPIEFGPASRVDWVCLVRWGGWVDRKRVNWSSELILGWEGGGEEGVLQGKEQAIDWMG